MSARTSDDETLRLSGLHFTWAEPVGARGASNARRVRLLAVLSLMQAVLTCIGALQAAWFEPPGMSRVVVLVLVPTSFAYLLAYVCARRGRVDAAAWLTLVLQCLVPACVRLGLRELDLAAMSTAAWLSLAILTANATLGGRGVAVAGVTSIACYGAVLALTRGTSAEIAEGLLFLSSTSAATYAYSMHRDGVEATRQEQLRRRNDELEMLRATLEARVRARTEELALKARELRRSCDQLHTNQAALLRTEKMAAVGRLTAGFAHELATPLATVLATLEEIEALRSEYASSIGDPTVHSNDHADIAADMAKALGTGRTAADRAIRFVRGMRAQTRDPGRCPPERFALAPVVNEVIELLAYQARAAHVSLALRAGSEPVHLVGVASRLSQVFTNLVQNGIDAIAETGRAGHVTIVVAAEQGRAVMRVEDDGPGVPEGLVGQVFEPLFTTKPHGKGTGLGLAIVREIVEDELGGKIAIESRTEGGAAFVMRIPLVTEGEPHGAQATGR